MCNFTHVEIFMWKLIWGGLKESVIFYPLSFQ